MHAGIWIYMFGIASDVRLDAFECMCFILQPGVSLQRLSWKNLCAVGRAAQVEVWALHTGFVQKGFMFSASTSPQWQFTAKDWCDFFKGALTVTVQWILTTSFFLSKSMLVNNLSPTWIRSFLETHVTNWRRYSWQVTSWLPPNGMLEDGFGWLWIAVPFVFLTRTLEEDLSMSKMV